MIAEFRGAKVASSDFGLITRENFMADPNDRFTWDEDDTYWRTNYRNRPYAASGGLDYDFYRPGYRYGYEAAHRYQNR